MDRNDRRISADPEVSGAFTWRRMARWQVIALTIMFADLLTGVVTGVRDGEVDCELSVTNDDGEPKISAWATCTRP